jgi:DNA repair protein RadC
MIKNSSADSSQWDHPGGKLRRSGPWSCTEAELLGIILGTGSKGKTATQIGQEILDKYGTVLELRGKTLEDLMQIKGLKAVKATRIAAVMELARRMLLRIERGE